MRSLLPSLKLHPFTNSPTAAVATHCPHRSLPPLVHLHARRIHTSTHARTHARRLKETQAINKSLSCLSDVFQALSKGSAHVPFRNSKLTYLLQDCFAGDGKTLMMVNLSPTCASSHESLCSLRFAATVNQVHMGTARKNISRIGGGGGAGAGTGMGGGVVNPASSSMNITVDTGTSF